MVSSKICFVHSRIISNKYLLKNPSRNFDVEWGYAFDVHLNAFYPLLVILHFLQLFFINREYSCASRSAGVSDNPIKGVEQTSCCH